MLMVGCFRPDPVQIPLEKGLWLYQIYTSWGMPNSTYESNIGGQKMTIVSYGNRHRHDLIFIDGRLDSWTEMDIYGY